MPDTVGKAMNQKNEALIDELMKRFDSVLTIEELGRFLDENRSDFIKLMCIPTPVKTGLRPILSSMTDIQLEVCSAALGIKNEPAIDRDFRIERIFQETVAKAFLTIKILQSDDSAFDFLQLLFKQQVLETTSEIFGSQFAFVLGLTYCFFDEEKRLFYCVIPDEIMQLFSAIPDLELIYESRKFMWYVTDYIVSAVNLYGIIEVKKVAEIFNNQNGLATPLDFFEYTYTLITANYTNVKHEWGCFIHSTIKKPSKKSTEEFFRDIDSIPLYIPEKNLFLGYVDMEFIEWTPQLKVLKKTLHEEFSFEDDRIHEFIVALQWFFKTGAPVGEYTELFEKYGISFNQAQESSRDTKTKKMEFIALIENVRHYTRLWIHKGHSPAEMEFLSRTANKATPTTKPTLTHQTKKVGRNQPCPCGSGKKYKYCCGKG